ncbi:MAG: hypothetical protein VX546_00355 [Myxococcota bacterium]|nr:hypothetical protein [Myxococcota bacterium]
MAATRCFIALLAALAAAVLGPTARADAIGAPTASTAEILQSIDHPERASGLLGEHWARLGLSGKYGLTYTRHLEGREKDMRFRVRGPALGRKTAVGLSFEIRF